MSKSIEILISTMNRNNCDFLNNMNIVSDVVIGNQNGKNEIKELKINDKNIKIINSDEVGLSKNRNLTLANASADICLLADDDLRYIDGYEKIVIDRFNKYSEYDIIIFNIIDNTMGRFVVKSPMNVNKMNFMRFGSVRIAFRLNSLIEKDIKFNESFGAGTNVNYGEDTIFLNECLSKGLKIIAVDDFILELTEYRPSTWFKGYDKKYINNKRKIFKEMFPVIWPIVATRDIIKHREKYKINGNILSNLLLILGLKGR